MTTGDNSGLPIGLLIVIILFLILMVVTLILIVLWSEFINCCMQQVILIQL